MADLYAFDLKSQYTSIQSSLTLISKEKQRLQKHHSKAKPSASSDRYERKLADLKRSCSQRTIILTSIDDLIFVDELVTDLGWKVKRLRVEGSSYLKDKAVKKFHDIPFDNVEDYEFSSIPVYTVTLSSELPSYFLSPSEDKKFVLGLDCVRLNGDLCLLQLSLPNAVYIVDVILGGATIIEACKPALESTGVIKVIHNCKRHSEVLYHYFGICLERVLDTQVAYSLIKNQEDKTEIDEYVTFEDLLADPMLCGISYPKNEQAQNLLLENPNVWRDRPIPEVLVRTAANEVLFFQKIYEKMMRQLSDRSLRSLEFRSAIYCRYFRRDHDNIANWRSLPPIAGTIDDIPEEEEETVVVLHVSPDKMGLITGGGFIFSVKQACRVEIFLGVLAPHDKVFITGSVSGVEKAEKLMRERLPDAD